MVWIEGLHSSPLAFLMIAASLRSMDPSLEEAAKMAGANGIRTARTITIQLIRPALIASALLMFVRTFSAFEVAAMVGLPAKVNVLAARIYLALSNFPADYGAAGTVAVLMMAITVVGIAIYSRALRQRDAFSTITGKNFRPMVMNLGAWKWPAAGFMALYICLVFVLPMLMLAWNSISPFYQVPSVEGLSKLTLNNYDFVLTFPQAQRAITNSVILSISTATLVMLLTAVVAWLMIRTNIRGRWMLDALVSMPVAFPALVFGVALIWLYLRLPIHLYGTLWIIGIAYTTQFLPYGMRYTSSSMLQIHRELEEASQVSGGSWIATFRRVLIPLLAPGLLAGWLYILLASFRELGSSILLVSAGTEVFSTLIFNMWSNGKSVELAALGMMMTVAFMVLYYLSLQLGRRMGVRAETH
jgi:iron(III) transport system permease protein